MKTITIIGATGYIGRHLVAELIRQGDSKIRILARSRREDSYNDLQGTGVEIVEGDLRARESLQACCEPGCTVVNLVYSWDGGEKDNLAVTANLLGACRAAGIGRLIHCSTAAVVGRVPDDVVTEATPCRPLTDYGITKLRVENAIVEGARNSFDAVILRPTSVFGPGGEPLKKLAGNLTGGSRFQNYLRSCLFGRRRMNLVHIANVVASILFLADCRGKVGGEVFIVSDDDALSNNFADVESFLMRELNIPGYRLPRLPVPSGVLSLLLRCLGRNNVNPRCNFSPRKLIDLGFERPVSFETGLVDYADWYRSCHPGIGSGRV